MWSEIKTLGSSLLKEFGVTMPHWFNVLIDTLIFFILLLIFGIVVYKTFKSLFIKLSIFINILIKRHNAKISSKNDRIEYKHTIDENNYTSFLESIKHIRKQLPLKLNEFYHNDNFVENDKINFIINANKENVRFIHTQLYYLLTRIADDISKYKNYPVTKFSKNSLDDERLKRAAGDDTPSAIPYDPIDTANRIIKFEKELREIIELTKDTIN
jgi:hypothetical protein